jgi:hypothetical protein
MGTPKKLDIDIYKSATNGRKYLSVPTGTDVTKINFPEGSDKDLRKLNPFKSKVRITAGVPLIALDSDDVISQIEKNGYALHGAMTVITTSVVSNK